MSARPESDRAHVWEPDPAVPAGALPLFGEFMAKWFAVAIVVVFAWAVWSSLDFTRDTPSAGIPAAIVLVGLGLILLQFVFSIFLMPGAGAARHLDRAQGGPRRADPGHGRGVARFRGRTTLPDGRPIAFQGARVPVSVAANVAATGQVWTAGLPRPSKSAAVGVPGHAVPGHAVFGTVRFG